MEIKIAILDMYIGVPNEGMRCIKMLLGEFLAKENRKGSFDVFDIRGKNEVPNMDEYDIFISSGGPGSPLLEGTDWEELYFQLVNRIFRHNQQNEQKKYLFLICHSFQLVVQHFDLAVACKRRSTSFGVMPIHKTEDGESEILFETLDEPFWAVDSRDYQVIQPKIENCEKIGAKILAIEKERPSVPLERAIMAIRFSDEIFGTQFHPEADAEGMKRYFLQEEKRNAVIKEYGIEKYEDMLEHLDDPDKIMFTESVLIPKFLEMAAENLSFANQYS